MEKGLARCQSLWWQCSHWPPSFPPASGWCLTVIQTAEAQSIQSVEIDVNEAMLASTPMRDAPNAAQVGMSAFSRVDGDSVTYSSSSGSTTTWSPTLSMAIAPKISPGEHCMANRLRGIRLIPDERQRRGCRLCLPNVADMTGTRYVYVGRRLYVRPRPTAPHQAPVTLVFMLTVVQNPIEVGGCHGHVSPTVMTLPTDGRAVARREMYGGTGHRLVPAWSRADGGDEAEPIQLPSSMASPTNSWYRPATA